MPLTAGGVPTPADLEPLTTVYFAGQKLRAADLAEVAAAQTGVTFEAGDPVRQSEWGDIGS